MLTIFKDSYIEKIYEGQPVKGKPKFTEDVIHNFRECVEILKQAESREELFLFKSLNFEALSGKLKGSFSIRVTKQYRLVFRLEKDVVELVDVVLIDDLTNHYK